FDSLSLADLTTDITCDAIVWRAAHEAQCFAHAIFGKQVQKRCLTEVYRECLFQRAVEDGLARRVDEVCQQDRVALGKRMRVALVQVKRRGTGDDSEERDQRYGELMTSDSGRDVLGAGNVTDRFLFSRNCLLRDGRRRRKITDLRAREANRRRGPLELRLKFEPLLETS